MMNLLNTLLTMTLSASGLSLSMDDVHRTQPSHRLLPAMHHTPVDTPKTPEPDTVTPPLMGPSLWYGVDTTVSPCVDFYQYVNGEWRSRTVLSTSSTRTAQTVDFFKDAYARTQRRLRVIVDSARAAAATTTDPAFKAIGTFYESCYVADSVDLLPRQSQTQRAPSKTPPPVVTRAEQCLQRTIGSLGGAVGQVFARDLLASDARGRMETLLEAIRVAVLARVERNRWMTPDEKTRVVERLRKLHLRVGMPTKLVDYQALSLSATDYLHNKQAITNFANRQWAQSIGGNISEQWKMSLLTPNAMYSPPEHAIEVPAVMFMPPFFDVTAEDAINFAGIGMVIAHEIFHSITSELVRLESPEMKTQIEQFKTINSSLGTVDNWNTDGQRTFGEDIADLGGVLAAYDAWKATLKTRKQTPAALVNRLTPDQRFFVALGRVWRSKWSGTRFNTDVHAAPFARVNAMVMQSPAFAKAFGCKEGDPMVLSMEKRASIW